MEFANRVTRPFEMRRNERLNHEMMEMATDEFYGAEFDHDVEALYELGFDFDEYEIMMEAAYSTSPDRWMEIIGELGFDEDLFCLMFTQIDFTTPDTTHYEEIVRREFFQAHGGAVLGLMSTSVHHRPDIAEEELKDGLPIYYISLCSPSPAVLAHELCHARYFDHSAAHAEATRETLFDILAIICPEIF